MTRIAKTSRTKTKTLHVGSVIIEGMALANPSYYCSTIVLPSRLVFTLHKSLIYACAYACAYACVCACVASENQAYESKALLQINEINVEISKK